MPKFKKYIFNSETLSYEVKVRSKWSRLTRGVVLAVGSVAMTLLYAWFYTAVLGFELPKTVMLKKKNADLLSRIDVMNRHLDEYDQVLTDLEMRDEDVYRSIFGLDSIPSDVRNAGFGGVNRYAYLDGVYHSSLLKKTVMRMDVLAKKTYIQTTSFDVILEESKHTGSLISSIPAIVPIVPDRSVFRISSSFGTRFDPFTGRRKQHNGIDFALPEGNPIYATGDGVVEKVKYSRSGYGNFVIIDHGFGYKTRYAHLQSIFVEPGTKVNRGDFLGKSGNSGRSSGPHLHYEVIYMGRYVNPYNFFDLDISVEEYSSMLRHVEAESSFAMHQSHKR